MNEIKPRAGDKLSVYNPVGYPPKPPKNVK